MNDQSGAAARRTTGTEPKPTRRIVAGENSTGAAVVFSDGPSPDIRTDAARPGLMYERLWVTVDTPAPTKGVTETVHLPHTLEPPPRGSICRIVTLPPDRWHMGDVAETKVRDFFTAMGSPGACLYRKGGFHPYMQRTDSLDFVYVLSGKVTLVLELEEVDLEEGDTVVQHGTAHAWSNRSDDFCRLFIASHGGARS